MASACITVAEWIEWKGGPCPLRYGQSFKVRYRDGSESPRPRFADENWMIPAAWEHLNSGSDIVAYVICG